MQDTQPWQVFWEGQGPHISKPPLPSPLRVLVRVVQMPPTPCPGSDIWDLLGCDQPSLWLWLGTIGMYSQCSWGGISRRVPEPGGLCVTTYTHVPVCAGTIHTRPRVPAQSFPWLQLGHRAVAPRLSEPQLWPYSVSARPLPPSPSLPRPALSGGKGLLINPTWRTDEGGL